MLLLAGVLNFRLALEAAATPKQIRDMMKVDGLTNDEVKSHLQVCSHLPSVTSTVD